MEISISSRHGHLRDESKQYIEKKLPKLVHLFDRLTSIKVTVDLGNHHEPSVEILVDAEHKHDFVAKESANVVEAAFDNALGKMDHQIRKYKERVQHHRHEGT